MLRTVASLDTGCVAFKHTVNDHVRLPQLACLKSTGRCTIYSCVASSSIAPPIVGGSSAVTPLSPFYDANHLVCVSRQAPLTLSKAPFRLFGTGLP